MAVSARNHFKAGEFAAAEKTIDDILTQLRRTSSRVRALSKDVESISQRDLAKIQAAAHSAKEALYRRKRAEFTKYLSVLLQQAQDLLSKLEKQTSEKRGFLARLLHGGVRSHPLPA